MTRPPSRYSHAVVPHVYVDGAAEAIDFYKRAFGAVELFRLPAPNGKIAHAEISICGNVVMLGDPTDKRYGDPRALGATTAGLHIFTDDNAGLLRRAVRAGAEEVAAPTEMFYGANSATLRDPYGHVWVLLTWKEDLEPAEIEHRSERQSSKSNGA